MGFTTIFDGPGEERTVGEVVAVGGRRGVVLVAVATDIDDGNIVLGVIVGLDDDNDDDETRPSELIYEVSVAKSEYVGDEDGRSGLGGCATANGEEFGNSGWRGEEFTMS
jgi:hypothetical protein